MFLNKYIRQSFRDKSINKEVVYLVFIRDNCKDVLFFQSAKSKILSFSFLLFMTYIKNLMVNVVEGLGSRSFRVNDYQ